jgi:transposase
MQEVIPMRRRATESVRVNQVDFEKVLAGRDDQEVVLGVDTGKYELLCACRWPDRSFERPWRVQNPLEIPTLIGLLQRLRQGRRLVVALEPSGTYGDALRQALQDANIPMQRISPKAAHDYAEIFDGPLWSVLGAGKELRPL